MSSKLDSILEEMHFRTGLPLGFKNDGQTHIAKSHANGDSCIDETRQQIKSLFLEIVENLSNLGEYEDWGTYDEGFTACQSDLKKKIEEL